MFDRNDALHWNDLNWALKAFWLATNGFVNIASLKLDIERTVFSVSVWNHVSFSKLHNVLPIILFLLLLRNPNNERMVSNVDWTATFEERNSDKFATFVTLKRWYRIRIIQSIRLLKKSNTVDTPYLAIEMKAGTTEKVKESTAECQKLLSL